MINEATIQQAIADIFDNIAFAKGPEGLYDPLRYMIAIGGKRIRPSLCLTTYSLFKENFENGIFDAAAALEVFHSFTLIHDDIMDNSPLRRGEPTVWKKWDENTAVLSGDVMSIDSYRRLCSIPAKVLPEALALFSETAAQVCEGQQYDMEFEDRDDVTMEEYIKMIGLKTAVLIACSAKMGAIVGEAPAEDADKLYNYGYNLGLAFQIADDYLDTFGDEKVFGKPIGGDILNSKKTWLLTKAAQKDPAAVAKALAMPVGTPEEKAAKIACVTGLYRDLGIDEDAKYEIIHYHSLAMDQAHNMSLGRVKIELLSRYADRLVGRTK